MVKTTNTKVVAMEEVINATSGPRFPDPQARATVGLPCERILSVHF